MVTMVNLVPLELKENLDHLELPSRALRATSGQKETREIKVPKGLQEMME
jgi:hypothetical protein